MQDYSTSRDFNKIGWARLHTKYTYAKTFNRDS